MKKYNHPIDDLFRDALKDHQMAPTESARRAFLKDALQLPPPRRPGGRSLILLSVLLALVGTGIILWYVYPGASATGSGKEPSASTDRTPAHEPNQANLSATNQPAELLQIDRQTKKDTLAETLSSKESIQSQGQSKPGKVSGQANSLALNPLQGADPGSFSTTHFKSTSKPVSGASETAGKEGAANDKTMTMPVVFTGQSTSNAILPSPARVASPDLTGNTTSGISPGGNALPEHVRQGEAPVVLPGAATESKLPVPDTIKVNKMADSLVIPVTGIQEKAPEKYRKPSNWIPTLGVYYSPEWMFNTLEGTKFVNNFGLEGTLHFGKFSVRTGAGVSIAKGTNELIVEYNEFLGEYNKLDSMDFTWSNPAQQYIPKYYMTNQDVWDSLMKLDYAKVVKRYTYLQIPLIMGYNFWQTDRVSLGVRVGPVMSVLLASKQLSATYDPGKNKVISINDIAPGQISLNWQVMAGFNTAIRVTKELQVEVEPWVRYYFNSVYEKPANNTKPWSVGVRAAFVVTF